MSLDALFLICNTAVLPGWALLLLAPQWKWTQRIAAFILPIVLAAVYIYLFIANFEALHTNYNSLSAVAYLFHKPGMLLAGWIHYLAFDLFIGAWMVRDAQHLRIAHLAVIPALLLTFLLGPAGLLLYLSMRGGLRRAVESEE